jgi:spore maturation protein SpmB
MKKMAKRSRRNDYGVKGIKKGQHLKAQEPQPSTSQKPSKPAPNPVAMERLKNAGIAVGQKRGLLTRLKEGYKANRAIGREMAAGGRKLGAAILFNPIASANRAAGTALHIRNFEKKHGLGDAAYRDSLVVMAYRKRQLRDAKVAYLKAKKRHLARRDSNLRRYDSQAKLIIAKRRYRDALRRYQDSVLDTLKQKFDIVFQKIKKTVKEYIKAFPFLSSLTANLMVMSSVYTTYGVVAGAPKVLSYLQYQSKIIDQSDFSVYGKAGLKARNVLIALYAVATKIIKAIIKLKIAKGISQTLNEK